MRVPSAVRRFNQSILKKISPEYSLEGLMLMLQYLGHLMRRANSLEKNLMLRKIEGKSRREQQRMKWLDGIMDSVDMSLRQLREMGRLACCSPWGHKSDMTERLNNNKEVINMSFIHTIYFLRTLQANQINFLYSKTSWSR